MPDVPHHSRGRIVVDEAGRIKPREMDVDELEEHIVLGYRLAVARSGSQAAGDGTGERPPVHRAVAVVQRRERDLSTSVRQTGQNLVPVVGVRPDDSFHLGCREGWMSGEGDVAIGSSDEVRRFQLREMDMAEVQQDVLRLGRRDVHWSRPGLGGDHIRGEFGFAHGRAAGQDIEDRSPFAVGEDFEHIRAGPRDLRELGNHAKNGFIGNP